MIVMKFGGTSVTDVEAVRRVAGVVGREKKARLVVVSALAKVTDGLLEVARLAEAGDATAARGAVRALHRRHEEMAALVRATERRADLLSAIDALFGELEGIVRALAVVEEVSPRSSDAIVAFGDAGQQPHRGRGARRRGASRPAGSTARPCSSPTGARAGAPLPRRRRPRSGADSAPRPGIVRS